MSTHSQENTHTHKKRGFEGVRYKLQPQTVPNNVEVSVSLGGRGRAKWLLQPHPSTTPPPHAATTFLACVTSHTHYLHEERRGKTRKGGERGGERQGFKEN